MTLDPGDLEALVGATGQCVFKWTTSQGLPAGIVMVAALQARSQARSPLSARDCGQPITNTVKSPRSNTPGCVSAFKYQSNVFKRFPPGKARRAAVRSTLICVRVGVTEIGRDGSIRRRVLDTWQLPDADRWEILIEQLLASPPPYRAALGSSVYVIHSHDRAVLIGEHDLAGPLQALVRMILAGGDPG